MNLYIKELADNTALVMTDIGQVIATFSSLDDAVSECNEWASENEKSEDYTEFYFVD